jgi:hypothetical protein
MPVVFRGQNDNLEELNQYKCYSALAFISVSEFDLESQGFDTQCVLKAKNFN